jgi:methyltransferase (TIGR00027 family)
MKPSLPSLTAEVVCLMRAIESSRPLPERILDDPYASWFLGPVGRAALAGFRASGRLGGIGARFAPGLTTFVAARHRYIDERLLEALEAGASQVVVLGAGYDTRAFRFAEALAGRRVFELDFPATSHRKQRLLEEHRRELPRVDVRYLGIDLRTESLGDRLLAGGFRPGERTFFVWEGVTMYLTRAAVASTLRSIREIAGRGSELAADFWYCIDDPGLLAGLYRFGASLLHVLGEPLTFSLHPEDAPAFLRRHGFLLQELAAAPELERRYVRDGRRIPPGVYVAHATIRAASKTAGTPGSSGAAKKGPGSSAAVSRPRRAEGEP